MCVVAIAECFRGDGEILANPIGTIPMIGGRLARATFEPDLAMTDGEARLIANDEATAWPDGKVVEHFNPYRQMFGWVWNGRRHVMMGGTQIDQYGNQNFAAIGDYRQPKVQLLGYRGAPGNTINDTTSYWVPDHTPTVLCATRRHRVRRRLRPGRRAGRRRRPVPRDPPRGHQPRRARLRDARPPHAPALGAPRRHGRRGLAATGFELVVPDDVAESRLPTPDELELIDTRHRPRRHPLHRGPQLAHERNEAATELAHAHASVERDARAIVAGTGSADRTRRRGLRVPPHRAPLGQGGVLAGRARRRGGARAGWRRRPWRPCAR